MEWGQQSEDQAQSTVEVGLAADESEVGVSPEIQVLAEELGKLAGRMFQLERASKERAEVLEEENNALKKELKGTRESHQELASEVRGLKEQIGTLESRLLALEQQKASTGVSQVGCLDHDPGSPREESQTLGNPVRSAAGEDTLDDELLAEIEAYETEQQEHPIGGEPRRLEAWWGGIYEPLRETPLEPEPAEFMGDLIQFEKDPVLVPCDPFGALEAAIEAKTELSLLLREFTYEKDWVCTNEDVLGISGVELGEVKPHPGCAQLSAPAEDKDSEERPVARGDRRPRLSSSLTHGWELISNDRSTERVLRRLAYMHRFINSCRKGFRPGSRELSTVDIDIARKRLNQLRGQEVSLWGESSVGWRVDPL